MSTNQSDVQGGYQRTAADIEYEKMFPDVYITDRPVEVADAVLHMSDEQMAHEFALIEKLLS